MGEKKSFLLLMADGFVAAVKVHLEGSSSCVAFVPLLTVSVTPRAHYGPRSDAHMWSNDSFIAGENLLDR